MAAVVVVGVQVENGTGIDGRAAQVAQALKDGGFSQDTSTGNGTPSATTLLTYPSARMPQAQAVAKALGLPSSALIRAAAPASCW
ncbi:hypothetical protein QF027_000177 [Streptomyces canus]|nr:hypothetical protein [Streptomyces canus]